MMKIVTPLLLILALAGCGPKIVLIEEPTVTSTVQLEAEENCDISRR